MLDRSTKIALWTAVGVAVAAPPAIAHPRRHHAAHAYGSGQPYGDANAPSSQAYGRSYYGAGGWEAEVIARRTAEAYHEPGTTLELAPDAKLSATGGPSGGIPGRDSD